MSNLKPLSTVDLALSAVGLIKSAALIFGVVLIEWARSRQRLAEGKQAQAESHLVIAKEQGALDAKASTMSSRERIDEFLKSRSKPRA